MQPTNIMPLMESAASGRLAMDSMAVAAILPA